MGTKSPSADHLVLALVSEQAAWPPASASSPVHGRMQYTLGGGPTRWEARLSAHWLVRRRSVGEGSAVARRRQVRRVGKDGGSANAALVGEGAVRTAKAQVGEGCGSTRTPCSSARSAVRKAKAVVSKARAVASAAKAASRAEPTEVVESA